MSRLLLIPAFLIASFIGFASQAHAGSHEFTIRGVDVYGDYLRSTASKYKRAVDLARRATTARARDHYLGLAQQYKTRHNSVLAKARRLPDTRMVWHTSGNGTDLGDMYEYLRSNTSRFGKTWHIYNYRGSNKISTRSPVSRMRSDEAKRRAAAQATAARKARQAAEARARAKARAARRKAGNGSGPIRGGGNGRTPGYTGLYGF